MFNAQVVHCTTNAFQRCVNHTLSLTIMLQCALQTARAKPPSSSTGMQKSVQWIQAVRDTVGHKRTHLRAVPWGFRARLCDSNRIMSLRLRNSHVLEKRC